MVARKINATEIRALPEAVQARVKALMQEFRTRRVLFEIHDPTFQLYLAEGVRYYFFYGEEQAGVTMQSQDSFHAGGHPFSYRVGQRVSLPQGTWVIGFEMFCGSTPFIEVQHWGQAALEEEGHAVDE